MQFRGGQCGSLRKSSKFAQGAAKAFLCRMLLSVLMLQLALPPQLWAQNQGRAVPPINAVAGASGAITGSFTRPTLSAPVAEALEDPFLRALHENRDGLAQLSRAQDEAVQGLRGSALLDADPFFLRSQRWVHTTSGKELQITAPGLRRVLHTDDFIFYASPSEEGLFVIDTLEATTASAEERPVPVFFMPLPEVPRAARLLPQDEVIVLRLRDGDRLPVLLADVNLVTQAGRLNLALAQMDQVLARLRGGTLVSAGALAALAEFTQTLSAAAPPSSGATPAAPTGASAHALSATQTGALTRLAEALARQDSAAGPLLPAPGSTAGFGILYTGFGAETTPVSAPAAPATSLHTRLLQKAWDLLSPTSAHAIIEIASGAAAGTALTAHLIRFAAISSIALVVSVVLKYTVLKGKIAEKRRCREALEAAQPPGKTEKTSWLARAIRRAEKNRIGREIVEIGDVYAHTLTTLYQFPSVTFGNMAEYAADRFLPRQAGPKKLLRRVLEHTALFVRDTSRGIPVNTMTWIMGALVLGGVDTALYYLQLYHLVPSIAQWIGEHIPFLRGRIEDAYAIGNPNTETLNRFALVTCLVGYYNSGASGLSQDLQGQLIGAIRTGVDEDLRRMGLNPDGVEVQPERERRIREHMNAALQRMGLPGPESFLFDAQSLHEGAMKIVGYGGRSRPGLMAPSLNAAIAEARRRGADDAVAILTETKRELSFLRQFAAAPGRVLFRGGERGLKANFKAVIATVRSARQVLVALSAEGHEAEVLAHALPPDWARRFGEPGARLAAQLFRGAYLSHLSGDDRHLSQAGEAAVVDAPTYEPPRRGVIARWQLRRITVNSQHRFIARTGMPFDDASATDGERSVFREVFADEYMRVVGLHPDESDADLNERIRASAEEASRTQLEADEGLRAHMATLDATAQARLRDELYAENLVQAYVSGTWFNESLSPLSPAQPGRLQRVRQWGPVRRSQVMTRALRTYEALFGDHSYRLGLGSMLDRTLPGWADFKLSNSRAYRGAFSGFLASYPFTMLFWGVSISPAMWALSLVGRFTVSAPSQYLNRLFRMQGLKPMSNVPSMVLFGVIYSFASFWGSIPMQIFAGDFSAMLTAGWELLSTPFILLRRFFFGG